MRHRGIRLGLPVLFGLAACAIVAGCCRDHSISLDAYQPQTKLEVVGSPKIALVDLVDKRQADDAVGMQVGELRNAFGAVSNKVYSKAEPIAWVGNALAEELKHAGFDVIKAGPATPEGAAIIVSGEVTKILLAQKGISWAGSYSTTVHLRLVIHKNGSKIYDNEHTATVMRGVSGVRDADLEEELTRALHELMDFILPKIMAVAV